MYDCLNIGILKTRDEWDILGEVLEHNLQFVDTAFAIDGSTDSRCRDIITSFDKFEWVKHDTECFGENYMQGRYEVDWVMGAPFEAIKERYKGEGWITLLYADEFFIDDPRDAIDWAFEEVLSVVWWNRRNYCVPIDLKDTYKYDLKKSVTEQIAYYTEHWYEPRCFKNIANGRYPNTGAKMVPDPLPQDWTVPRIKSGNGVNTKYFYNIAHYEQRSPEQAIAHAKDRTATRRNFYKGKLLETGFFFNPEDPWWDTNRWPYEDHPLIYGPWRKNETSG